MDLNGGNNSTPSTSMETDPRAPSTSSQAGSSRDEESNPRRPQSLNKRRINNLSAEMARKRLRLHQGAVGRNCNEVLEPALYLLNTAKFHDCHLTVGDPRTGEVEKIGVVTSNLAAHSSVFRQMLVDNELADPSGANTHITDVNPQVFMLMLRHVYGEQLPTMSKETAVQLALCADKYNIGPLLHRATAVLTPTSMDQVFPALRCVVYIDLPNLNRKVIRIIQNLTPKVVACKEFLDLDDNCLEFIVKQQKLAIRELELWKTLVKWAKHQTKELSEMRKILEKPLKHLRFLTMTQSEILTEVMPAQILSAEEIVDLLSAVVNKQTLKSPGLCVSIIKREYCWPEIVSINGMFLS